MGSQYRSLILLRRGPAPDGGIPRGGSQVPAPHHHEIQPLSAFYRAEDHHQDYYARNSYAGYCSFVIRPKLQKLGLE
jgi:peptide-methionine (S)-S-oxide reductase